MSDSKQPLAAQSKERGSFAFALVLVAVAVVAYVALRSSRPMEPHLKGVALPPLEVAGWFNAATPLRNEDLRGKVVLVDCWFVDCPPCRAAMPHLAEFNKRFRDYGVVLIGLTPDSGSDVPRAENFVKSVAGVDWPIGYGANIPLEILGIHEFPTLILFDKSGRAVWAGNGLDGLEDAALKALAAPS